MKSKILDLIVSELIDIKEDRNCIITDYDIENAIEIFKKDLVKEIREEMEEI